VGVGAEQNFGMLFVRGAVDAEIVAEDNFSITQATTAPRWSFSGISGTSNAQWTARATLMAGLRF
jgi:hypothetical protein